jgi:hypothetical protein
MVEGGDALERPAFWSAEPVVASGALVSTMEPLKTKGDACPWHVFLREVVFMRQQRLRPEQLAARVGHG